MDANAELSRWNNLPNVYGEGGIFAFSGMDGETCTASGFVATLMGERYGLLVHTPMQRRFTIGLPELGEVVAVTGDVLAVRAGAAELALAFSAWHTLVGVTPVEAEITLQPASSPVVEGSVTLQISPDPEGRDVLALAREGGRFALAYGRTRDEAGGRARAGLTANLPEVFHARLAYLAKLPVLADAAMDRLLKKCASVMKVNSCAAEGRFAQAWSTPDRVPHQDLWLWDSVFHSLAMNLLDADLSWAFLKSVLDTQREDGMIPHQSNISGGSSNITQPPLLVWGMWENYQVTGDAERLAYALPRLTRYVEWNCRNRDANGNGLFEWLIEGDPFCRSGESGLDNSPRFDGAVALDAVDFSTFMALEMHYLARMAAALGEQSAAEHWQQQSAKTAKQIIALLWDDGSGFYYDRDLEGRLTYVRAVSGFLPLLLEGLPASQVDQLLGALGNPTTFHTPMSVPSVAVSDPMWSTDMWRGATWINFNYFIILGLRKQGRQAEARWLREQTIDGVNKYYEQYGVTFEFYDAKDERPPTECDRKGKNRGEYNIRGKFDSIRDYHWTAALVFCLLCENTRS